MRVYQLLWTRRAWTSWLVLAVLPFLLIAQFNYPSIHDDYMNANSIRQHGRLGYVAALYDNWTGRYTELLLKGLLHPLSYQRTALLSMLQSIAVILLLIGGLYAVLRLLLGPGGPARWRALALALLVFLLFANGVPDIGTAFYWFGGYTSYTAGLIASLAAFAGLVGLARAATTTGRLGYFLLAGGAALLATGAYDTCLVALTWVLLGVAGQAWRRRSSVRWWYLALLLVNSAGAVVSIVAPGNAARAGLVGLHPRQEVLSGHVLFSLIKSFSYTLVHIVSWQNSLLLLAGTLLVAGTLARHTLYPDWFRRLHPLVLLAWLLLGCSLLVLPSIIVYQNVWYHTWHCVYGYFLLGWLGLLTVVFVRYAPGSALLQQLAGPAGRRACQVVFLVLCFCLDASNTRKGYADLLLRAPEHYRRVRAREQAMLETRAAGQRIGTIMYLYSRYEDFKVPQLLYAVDFNDNDRRAYARFHGLDTLEVQYIP